MRNLFIIFAGVFLVDSNAYRVTSGILVETNHSRKDSMAIFAGVPKLTSLYKQQDQAEISTFVQATFERILDSKMDEILVKPIEKAFDELELNKNSYVADRFNENLEKLENAYIYHVFDKFATVEPLKTMEEAKLTEFMRTLNRNLADFYTNLNSMALAKAKTLLEKMATNENYDSDFVKDFLGMFNFDRFTNQTTPAKPNPVSLGEEIDKLTACVRSLSLSTNDPKNALNLYIDSLKRLNWLISYEIFHENDCAEATKARMEIAKMLKENFDALIVIHKNFPILQHSIGQIGYVLEDLKVTRNDLKKLGETFKIKIQRLDKLANSKFNPFLTGVFMLRLSDIIDLNWEEFIINCLQKEILTNLDHFRQIAKTSEQKEAVENAIIQTNAAVAKSTTRDKVELAAKELASNFESNKEEIKNWTDIISENFEMGLNRDKNVKSLLTKIAKQLLTIELMIKNERIHYKNNLNLSTREGIVSFAQSTRDIIAEFLDENPQFDTISLQSCSTILRDITEGNFDHDKLRTAILELIKS